MADLLGSFLGLDPEELARQAVANGRSDDLERFSSKVLRHLHLSRSSVPSTATAVVDGLSAPAEAPAVPAVTPSYEGIGPKDGHPLIGLHVLEDEMAGLSDEDEGERHEDEEDEEHDSKPAAAASEHYDDNNGDNNGGNDADSVATVPKPTPIDDNGDQGDVGVAAPTPVQTAAARSTPNTQPGAKFTINERVVVLAKNPALAARGRYEAAVLKVGPKTRESGRCRKSKFEYLVRYDGYGSDWDEWLPESSVEERNDQTLRQVSVPKFKASVKKTPRVKRKDAGALESVAPTAPRQRSKRKQQNNDVAVDQDEERASGRRAKKRSKRQSTRNLGRVESPASPVTSSTNSNLVKSEGRTRDELNALDRSSDFGRMKEKTGIFAKFGMASVATKGGKVSHLVMNDEWNKLATRRGDMQDLEFGTGEGRARAGQLLTEMSDAGVPFFHAPKIAEATNKIFYVGHWATVHSETVHYRRPKNFMGKPRQMRVRLKFVRYDRNIDRVMRDGRL